MVPLVARGRTLGALSFLHAARDLRYDPGDLEFLAELGDRAALALDNARLYRERDRIAEEPAARPAAAAAAPRSPGLEISVVFEAAGEGIEIGGDLYDVLPTEDGCWILIGDVAGKGSAAAGVSVAVRHSVRGLDPRDRRARRGAARVNELLLDGDSLNDFATAMLVRLRARRGRLARRPSPRPATRRRSTSTGGGRRAARRRRRARRLGGRADVERHEATLGAGETLVLCTDGWLEAGPAARTSEPEACAEMAQSLAGLELGELTERLRADAVARGGGALRDDLVILALRTAGPGMERRGGPPWA